MITTKQRAMLRALGNTLDPVFQVGKDGLSENSITAINLLLEARELIKIKVLKNSPEKAKDVVNKLAKLLSCEIVQVIGQTILIFRRSTRSDINHIELI